MVAKKLLSVEEAELLQADDIWSLYRKHINPYQVELLGSFGPGRKTVDRAEGCFIFESDGRKILDLTGGIGVLNHGHNHPKIIKKRIAFATERKMEVHKSYLSPYVAVLSHNIANLLPGDLEVSYFPNSGAESVEGAVKLAYKAHSGRRDIVAHADISFHGKLLGAGSVTGSPENHFAFPKALQTDSFKFNDIQSLNSLFERNAVGRDSRLYALLLEPLNASSMTAATEAFLREARRLCTHYDVALIFDEVYSGWGKTGHLFKFMEFSGLAPDILCYAKSLGGGKASIAGYTATRSLASRAYFSLRDATLHSTTYFGFGEETVTAIEAIRVLVEDGLVDRSSEIGREFPDFINRVKNFDSDFELSGAGALWGITIKPSLLQSLAQVAGIGLGLASGDSRFGSKVVAGAIVNHLYERHGILTYLGFNFRNPVIISFPLVAGKDEVRQAQNALVETLNSSMTKLVVDFASGRLKGPRANV